jgi:hypothetical protein
LPTGRPGSIQAGQKHLVNFCDFFDGLILADNLAAQGGFKLSGITAAAAWIEYGSEVCSHKNFPACEYFIPFPGRCVRIFGLLPAFTQDSPCFLGSAFLSFTECQILSLESCYPVARPGALEISKLLATAHRFDYQCESSLSAGVISARQTLNHHSEES